MARQLPLFSNEKAASDAPETVPVGPAAVGSEALELASALPTKLHLGTSSWFFPGWRGLVWDRAADETTLSRHGLAAYARHPLFSTVCVDRAFYAPLEHVQYTAYAEQVPAAFRFVVKAPAAVTQSWLRDRDGKPQGNPTFLDASAAIAQLVTPATEGLGDKAGPLLFQFPPLGRAQMRDPARFVDRLHAFLTALPQGPFYAVEVRDAALLTRRFFAALREAGAHYCVAVHPRLPAVAVQAAAMAGAGPAPLVVRWNLNPREEYEAARARYAPFDRLVDPDVTTRESIARLVAAALRAGEPAYVIANNKAEGSAPLTLTRLAAAIAAALKPAA
ncbi:MAG TPA: DUF72 domain-containing protein [Burkholderiales bacterium]|nr:DUF72 domain-containing protein [Burkholderiales bacterium]